MPDSTTTPQAPRIAIKFGTAVANTTKAAYGAKKPQPPSSLGKRPRSHALNPDSDSEDEDEHLGKHEAVTTLGGSIAERGDRPRDTKLARTDQKTLVIACQTGGGWKAAAKAQRGGQPSPHKRGNNPKGLDRDTEPADHEKDIKWGLNVTQKPVAEDRAEVEGEQAMPESRTSSKDQNDIRPSSPRNADQDAMDALLGNDTRKKKIVISDADTEQDQFKAAVQAAGDVSTIEEYDQIPDGEFGMAMLRGMGYDESKKSAQPTEVRRRPALLGLGAKEDEEIKKADIAKKYGHRNRPPRLQDYRREEDAKRKQREERYSSSYKHERERERSGYSSSRRHDDRDHNRDSDRTRDRDGGSRRHRDRHSRY
ncbi:hypothetical protein TruAng_002921 [Truncatella angustata]|nr:hypothetical protein TruAng_002921 [Truncatella angustata]